MSRRDARKTRYHEIRGRFHSHACSAKVAGPAQGVSLNGDKFARHRDACRLRQADFYCFYRSSFYKNDPRSTTFLEKHCPIIRHPAARQTVVRPDNPNPIIRDCFLARYCWYVMGGSGLVSRNKLLPDDIWYDMLYDNVSTRDQMIDLILESRPWARLERLRPITEIL
jgi:hypothetical protein